MTIIIKPGENCGGPMICRKCAMKWAQKYYDAGKNDWAEVYRARAVELLRLENLKRTRQYD
mgnify:CR=1 FL=1